MLVELMIPVFGTVYDLLEFINFNFLFMINEKIEVVCKWKRKIE